MSRLNESPGEERTELPLDGVRVLDFGQYISGPCAGVVLAELGAQVVKVESEVGDPFRKWDTEGGLSATFQAFNRGKKSISVDLKDEDQRGQLLKLLPEFDVMIENFRPGVTARLGVSVEIARAINPKLIYCSITGFGSTGPYASFPAYDGVALGYSGLAGLLLDPEDLRMRGPALADAITGHSAATQILAALHARQRDGRGRHLDVSMLGAVVHFLHSAVSKKVVEDREEGPYTRPHSSQSFVFRCSDGGSLLIHLSSPVKFWQALLAALGRSELEADERFNSRIKRAKHFEELRMELAPEFSKMSRDEWLREFQDLGIPCAPVNSIGEALADPQVVHLGVVQVDETDAGRMPVIRPPAKWDGELLPRIDRAPYLGEHNELLLD